MHTNTENLFGRFYNMKTTLNDDMIGTPAKRSFTFFRAPWIIIYDFFKLILSPILLNRYWQLDLKSYFG